MQINCQFFNASSSCWHWIIPLTYVNCPQTIVDYLSFCFYCIFYYCRYPNDEFDRYWFPIQGSNATYINSTSPLQSLVASKNVRPNNGLWGKPPETVMDTALTCSGNITITFPDTYIYAYIFSFYYAELNSTANASSRNFFIEVSSFPVSILLNPYSNSSNSAFNASMVVYPFLVYTPGTDIVLYPDQTVSSPLGPIANALESWEINLNPMATMTDHQDGELLIWL